MGAIGLDGVTKRFPDGTVAVRHLDLSVADGELLALVGPSGCGKSTILRMVAGLERTTEGTITIDGRVADALGPGERGGRKQIDRRLREAAALARAS
ncbi:MAG: ATP-binding cassette domain-containing protein [Acidimicrobiia bacterium]|nr:ATP-binding cassette domain-containing protein [Acidimicrobiia bacterium]